MSTLGFVLVGAVAWIAYATESASAFLPLSGFVSNPLATITSLSFIGLFLYWAYNRDAGTSE